MLKNKKAKNLKAKTLIAESCGVIVKKLVLDLTGPTENFSLTARARITLNDLLNVK